MKKVLSIIGLEALYFLILFGCAFLGFVSPFCWIYQPVVSAFLAATPILIVCKHWQKFGGVLILSGIFSILMILMGEVGHTIQILAIIVVLLLAEAIRYLGKYSRNSNRLGYAVAALVPVCQLLLLWTDTEFYYSGAVEEMGSVSYAEGLMTFANPIGLLALIVCTLIAGYCGALVSEKIFKERVCV